MTNTNNKWLFQTADGRSIHEGSPTDSRGLRLRAESGYTHVKMTGTPDDGWLQMSVAIRKVDLRERLADLAAA